MEIVLTFFFFDVLHLMFTEIGKLPLWKTKATAILTMAGCLAWQQGGITVPSCSCVLEKFLHVFGEHCTNHNLEQIARKVLLYHFYVVWQHEVLSSMRSGSDSPWGKHCSEGNQIGGPVSPVMLFVAIYLSSKIAALFSFLSEAPSSFYIVPYIVLFPATKKKLFSQICWKRRRVRMNTLLFWLFFPCATQIVASLIGFKLRRK